MPTLTAPAFTRAAAANRGLALPAEPTAAGIPATPDERQVLAAQRREQQRIAREHLWPLLSEVFPDAFRLPAVPLAIGIHRQILDVAGDTIDADELGAFMRYWTTRWSYLMAVARGEPRRNLDGSIADAPTSEQREDAARRLGRANRDRLQPN